MGPIVTAALISDPPLAALNGWESFEGMAVVTPVEKPRWEIVLLGTE